jgi:hypothetical protein
MKAQRKAPLLGSWRAWLDGTRARAAVGPSRTRRLVLCLALSSCGATEGPLLVRGAARDAGGDGQVSPMTAAVRPDMSLQYQITDQLDTEVDAELFVVDLFATSQAQLARLHEKGRVVIAYVSVGSLEPWREDAARFPRATVGAPLASYPNEAWLDTRSAEVRRLMEARFDRAVALGFDGLFASTLGAHQASSGFPLTESDELDYARFLARTAHVRALSIGLSGDFELAERLASEFDFVIAEGCIARAYCDELAPLLARGLPVFDLETTSGDRALVCAEAASYGIPVTFKRPSYDAVRNVCP